MCIRDSIIHGGRLPVHVHFVMDEFANVALPDEFDKLLSTCLLYTSDAADDLLCVDLGGRRIIKKKKYKQTHS